MDDERRPDAVAHGRRQGLEAAGRAPPASARYAGEVAGNPENRALPFLGMTFGIITLPVLETGSTGTTFASNWTVGLLCLTSMVFTGKHLRSLDPIDEMAK